MKPTNKPAKPAAFMNDATMPRDFLFKSDYDSSRHFLQTRSIAMARYPLCPATEIPEGQMKRFKVNGAKVLVYHLTDGFYATQSNCTHTFGPLQRGKIIDGCKIQCPLHRACFDVRTGEVVQWANFPPGIQVLNILRKEKALKTYPVTVDNEQVFVDV
jgi:3-phenylpropionate/trans-cinnamate dioxygenase ferredoxin subunit